MHQTNENLKSALTGESQANMRYIMFSEVAKREGYGELASHFRRTTEEETKHARALFEMLYPQISAKDALKMALEIETLETRRYSEYAVTAEEGRFLMHLNSRGYLMKPRNISKSALQPRKNIQKPPRKALSYCFQEYEQTRTLRKLQSRLE